jgi:hypothetical protein
MEEILVDIGHAVEELERAYDRSLRTRGIEDGSIVPRDSVLYDPAWLRERLASRPCLLLDDAGRRAAREPEREQAPLDWYRRLRDQFAF